MRPTQGAWRPVLVAGLGLLVAGCVTPGGTPPASASARSEAPVSSPSPSSAPPSETPATVLETVDPQIPGPPSASIAVEGGDPVVGELGSFTWNNGGSSSPGLDGTPIHVGAGEPMTISFAEPVAIDGWQVSRVRPGNHDGIGAIPMDDGSGEPIVFAAPPAGIWSVEVRAIFAGNLGSAAWYWRMEVD